MLQKSCGFPNSFSSPWCWPRFWVCVFPSAKTQCQPRSCCFSRRKILLPFLKICSADSKFPSPSPVLGKSWQGLKGLGWFLLLPGTAPTGILGEVSERPSCGSAGDRGQVGTAKGTLTRKHNKRRRMKPSRVNRQMRMMAQN